MESDLMADANFHGQSPVRFESMGSLQFKVVVLCFLAILFDGIDTTAIGVAVSYTHLDVYKRQCRKRQSCRRQRQRGG